MTIMKKGFENRAELLKWLVTILIPLSIYCIPINAVFTAQIRLFFVYTLFVIFLMAFEFFDIMFTAVLIPLGYIMLQLAPAAVVYSGWAGGIPAMIMGGLLLSNILEDTGLLKRIAYWCITKVGGSFRGILFGVFLAGVILSLLTAAGAPIIMAALCYGICKALNLGKSKESSAVMLTGAFSSVAVTSFIYYPAMAGLLEAGGKQVDPALCITYFSFLVSNFPYIFLLLFLVFLISVFYKPSKPMNGKSYFMQELKQMGKIRSDEIKVGVLTLLIVFLLMTVSIHHIPGTMVFAIVPWALYLPGIRVGSTDSIRRINYGLVFFIVACLSIGAVSGNLGLGELLAKIVVPILQPFSSNIVLIFIWLLGVILNFILTPFAIAAAFAEPIARIAVELNISVEGALYVLYNSLDTVFLPYEYAGYLIFYGFGIISIKEFVKILSAKAFFSIVFIFLVMIPFWRLIGVL